MKPHLNVVMLSFNRPRLLRQAVESLIVNTSWPATLTIVDDVSTDGETLSYLDELEKGPWNTLVLHNDVRLGVGGSRNKGVKASEAQFGRGEVICLCDNDIVFQPHWIDAIYVALKCFPQCKIIGGYNHPFNGPRRTLGKFSIGNGQWFTINTHDALNGLHWTMEWWTWDWLKGLKDDAIGCCQSEDVEASIRVRNAGWEVASLFPPVVLNCGRTNSEGKLIPGANDIEWPTGVVVE